MKINWQVRLHNPMWWAQVGLAILTPILTYFGLTAADMTTWGALGDILKQAVMNPYVQAMILVSLYNSLVDPTTKGIGDSELAMTYKEPKDDSKT